MGSPNKASSTVHLNAKIDPDLKQQMKVHCAMKDMSIQDFLANAIRDALAKEKKKKK